MLKTIQKLGTGIGYRQELAQDIEKYASEIDCLEVIAEHYMWNPNALIKLQHLSERFKIIPHGINLSIASPKLNKDYLEKIKKICEVARCTYYSDHLSLTKVPGISSSHLTPVWLTDEVLQTIINNIHVIQDYIRRPLILENITYDFVVGKSSIPQAVFFNEITRKTGCGILLDVTNLHANAHNHDFDPFQFIDHLSLDAIVQVHLAGGFYTQTGKLIDSHSHQVELRSYELLKYASKNANIKCVILERDTNYPANFTSLLQQMNKAHEITFGARGSTNDIEKK